MSQLSSPLHVLVLDDDEKILRLMKIFMRQLGYRVSTAQDGREGIRKILRHHFDMIIVDVQMPNMDGLTFAEEVLRLWPWEKIILCTGFLDAEVKSKAKALGIEAILEKPISFNTLEESIQQVYDPDTTEHGKSISKSMANEDHGCELSYLREFTDTVMENLSFGQALAEFPKILMKTIPSAAAGVFGLQGNYGRFVISSVHPLEQAFVDEISNRITAHLEFISGEPLPCTPGAELEVLHSRRDSLRAEDYQVLMAPVAGGRNAVGIIFLIVPIEEMDLPAQTSPLRICAHHLSTVIECLEQVGSRRIEDPLTGSFTWKYMELQVAEAWSGTGDASSDLGWLDVDLSHFNKVNDTYGFKAGDHVLRDLAKVIESHLEIGECCGRRGADEFCILIKHVTEGRLSELTRHIEEGINNLNPLAELGGDPVTCSIGVATTTGDHGITSASQLVECAEHARFFAEQSEDRNVIYWSDLKSSGKASISLHPILVVDDDPQITVLVKRILNKNMFEVTGAETVAEAVSLLEKGNRYEVMLTDLSLPHQDGIEMMRLAQKIDPDMIPVVVSGNISKNSEGQLKEKGAYDIIRKPFEPEHLRKVVQDASENFTRTIKKQKTI